MLFQKRDVRTKFDICVFIIFDSMMVCFLSLFQGTHWITLFKGHTHVANAYDKDIWAHVGGDQWYMKSTSDQGTVGNITPGVNIKFEWDKVDKSGYTKIALKSFLPFQQDSDTVYISIISEDGIICENYHRKMNESAIVDADGYVKDTKWGQYGQILGERYTVTR